MTISMYTASVPVFRSALDNLTHVLQTGEAHAEKSGIPPEVLLHARLIPDMFPLLKQVQIATDLVKNGAARLAAVEPPKIADDETSFAELFERIKRVQAFLDTLQPEQIDGSEGREIHMHTRRGDLDFVGQDYLLGFAIPSVFFHCVTAYDILRQAGVAIGKADYLGQK